MARLGKAARGKRRWIGVRISSGTADRGAGEEILGQLLEGLQWKMYDHYIASDDSARAIVRVRLTDCEEATSRINSDEGCCTITRSGKIKLVRERLGIGRQSLRK
ncbi:MAG: hypothetical protein EVA35_03730 [Candidatus Poseidoniales archaeon]|nr:MAG: hypothetical protein EVA35_03730 [Candidatus Poseidoniales archaeon]